MVRVTTSFELTKSQMDALQFEARSENLEVEELIAWMVRQNISPLLDVIETEDEARRQELTARLQVEEAT